jgi:hypothetical protein
MVGLGYVIPALAVEVIAPTGILNYQHRPASTLKAFGPRIPSPYPVPGNEDVTLSRLVW